MKAALLAVAMGVLGGPTPLPISDVDAEPNNDFAHASPVKVPLINANGCLEAATDVDFYSFTLPDDSPLFVGAKSKAAAQYNVALFNAKHESISSGHDVVDLPNLDAGSYFVRISGLEKDCYELQIFTETRLPPFG